MPMIGFALFNNIRSYYIAYCIHYVVKSTWTTLAVFLWLIMLLKCYVIEIVMLQDTMGFVFIYCMYSCSSFILKCK